MDAQIGLARGLVPTTATLHVRVRGGHPSIAVLGDERMGSGVLVGAGVLLTVNYVVIGGREITATLPDERSVPAEILAQDYESGIAVLRIPLGDLPAAVPGDSRRLRTGQEVFILASTGPTERRVAAGAITDLSPFDAYWEYMLESAIQTSAANPGLGGGPLFDLRGRLVGITSLNLGQVGRLSLAIPIHLFTDYRDDLLRFGQVPGRIRRAWLGIYPEPMPSGVVVVAVVPDGPAARAGMREGDAILAVGLRQVATRRDLYRELWKHPAGARLRCSLLRERERISLEVESTDRAEFYR